MTDVPGRSRFAGVANIVRFNPRFFLCALATIGLAFAALCFAKDSFPASLYLAGLAGLAIATWWFVASLLVSWWVYDLSGLYRWDWLRPYLGPAPSRLVVAHAGFDEVTSPLRAAFPEREIVTLDFHDPLRMTEPSIRRARQLCPPHPGTLEGNLEPWPSGIDAPLVLFFLSAHEWRNADERAALLRRAREALAEGGRIVLLEHLRDVRNFIAFGPGFFHFHSAKTWETDWQSADLECLGRFRVAFFLGGFVLAPRTASHD